MKRVSAKEQLAAAQPTVEDKRAKKEKRRARKEPPAPVVESPADLPLAVVADAPVALVETTEIPDEG
jgi:hypothetical protein